MWTTKKHIFKSLSDGLQIATFEPMAKDSVRYSSFFKKKRRVKFQKKKTRATYAERQNSRRFADAIRCNSGSFWENLPTIFKTNRTISYGKKLPAIQSTCPW